eukprot:jgi/Bigna1/137785/aug1.41_g12493
MKKRNITYMLTGLRLTETALVARMENEACAFKLKGVHLQKTPSSRTSFQTQNAAGMMCFSVDPKTKNVYISLGQESLRNKPESRLGPWCDFGGRIEQGESEEMAAAREFSEESVCVVQLFEMSGNTLCKNYANEVQSLLESKLHLAKCTMLMTSDEVQDGTKVCFLKQVPWQPEVPKAFSRTRTIFLDLQKGRDPNSMPFTTRRHPGLVRNSNHLVVGMDEHCTEKCASRWWSLDRLEEVLLNRGHFEHSHFRKSFLPVLHLVVSRLKLAHDENHD